MRTMAANPELYKTLQEEITEAAVLYRRLIELEWEIPADVEDLLAGRLVNNKKFYRRFLRESCIKEDLVDIILQARMNPKRFAAYGYAGDKAWADYCRDVLRRVLGLLPKEKCDG